MHKLSSEQLNNCRLLLTNLEAEMLKVLETNQDASEIVTLDQSRLGRLSRMDAMQQHEMAKAELQHMKLRLKLIKIALNKFSNDDYSFCEDCDSLISYERLLIKPESQFCIGCQSKRE